VQVNSVHLLPDFPQTRAVISEPLSGCDEEHCLTARWIEDPGGRVACYRPVGEERGDGGRREERTPRLSQLRRVSGTHGSSLRAEADVILTILARQTTMLPKSQTVIS
jgi:hypothetical protein